MCWYPYSSSFLIFYSLQMTLIHYSYDWSFTNSKCWYVWVVLHISMAFKFVVRETIQTITSAGNYQHFISTLLVNYFRHFFCCIVLPYSMFTSGSRTLKHIHDFEDDIHMCSMGHQSTAAPELFLITPHVQGVGESCLIWPFFQLNSPYNCSANRSCWRNQTTHKQSCRFKYYPRQCSGDELRKAKLSVRGTKYRE